MAAACGAAAQCRFSLSSGGDVFHEAVMPIRHDAEVCAGARSDTRGMILG